MLYFNCDYTEGAHPTILALLQETNMEQTIGYGEDFYCQKAAKLILDACAAQEGQVHFLSGGTQANLTVIKSALRPHQGVLCAETGHINTHETGAIEATGHKVLTLPGGAAGKITAEQVHTACTAHAQDAAHEHTVQPKMVYISLSTENGMLYTKEELFALRQVCDMFGLFLFLDGARLAYALTADGCDVTMPDVFKACDVFTVGGTKCGALFGEAVVIRSPALAEDFRYLIKQTGAMLAKGRMLGIQFYALFRGELYFRLGSHANRLAQKLAGACQKAGLSLSVVSPTNQQFVIMPNSLLAQLSKNYVMTLWEKTGDTHSTVRLCTSWATTEENLDALIADINRYAGTANN